MTDIFNSRLNILQVMVILKSACTTTKIMVPTMVPTVTHERAARCRREAAAKINVRRPL